MRVEMREGFYKAELYVIMALLAGGCGRKCEEAPKRDTPEDQPAAAVASPAPAAPSKPSKPSGPPASPRPPAKGSRPPVPAPPAPAAPAPTDQAVTPLAPRSGDTPEALAALNPAEQARRRKAIELRLPKVQQAMLATSAELMAAEKQARQTDAELAALYNAMIAANRAYKDALASNTNYKTAQESSAQAFSRYDSILKQQAALQKEKSE